MKRFLLIAAGTIGGLGAVLSVTPPQLGATDLGLGQDLGSLPATDVVTQAPVNDPTISASPTATVAPTPTQSAKPVTSTKPKATKSPSAAASQSQVPTPTSTPTKTATPTTSATVTPTPVITATPTPTPVISQTAAPTPTKTATPTPAPTKIATSTPTPAPTKTATPAPTKTATPTPTKTATPTPTVKSTSETFTGPVVNVSYGNVQVEITVLNGKITDIKALQAPSGRSDRYSNYALPILKKQTLAAQSTTIQGASGASYTTYGWRKSLQGAMTKAGL
jgi:uncharacterized protein with FMN-binding domain